MFLVSTCGLVYALKRDLGEQKNVETVPKNCAVISKFRELTSEMPVDVDSVLRVR